MKYTKKEIRKEYQCMESVGGTYPEGDETIKKALVKAHNSEYNTTQADIVDDAHNMLNQ